MMHFRCSSISLGLALGVVASASPIIKHDKRSSVERNGTLFTVFEHAATDVKIEYVKNSGICETTPGVNQYSGYLSNGPDMHSTVHMKPGSLPALTQRSVVLVLRSSVECHNGTSCVSGLNPPGFA